jgi:hypothetical protein
MGVEEDSEEKPPNSLMEIELNQRRSSPMYESTSESIETNLTSKMHI